jgi:hypothetical protein
LFISIHLLEIFTFYVGMNRLSKIVLAGDNSGDAPVDNEELAHYTSVDKPQLHNGV